MHINIADAGQREASFCDYSTDDEEERKMARYYSSSIRSSHGLGIELEDELVCTCSEWFKKKGDPKGFVCTSGTAADKFAGTVALPEDIDLFCGTKVRFGVRTGNSHKGFTKFERPVLVIGIDGADDSFIGSWLVNIVEAFGKKLQDIINLGQDQYWDWCEANGAAY